MAYLRISQDRYQDGLAIDRQRDDIAKLVQDRGLSLDHEYSDTVSAAGRKRRVNFEMLLEHIEGGSIGTVAAYAFDRLARHPRDALKVIDACRVNKVRLIFVTDADMDVSTPGGELVASVRASVARAEIAQKSERQKAQRRQEAEQGRTPPARRAFGFFEREAVTGERYPVARPHPVEAPLMAEAYRQVLAGRTMGSIARWLNAQGAPTPRGRPWSSHNLRTAMVNPRYKGVRGVRMLKPGRAGEAGQRDEFHTEVAPGNWPAIIDPETWAAVQVVLRDPARRDNHPVNEHGARYLLPYIAVCGSCGGHLITGSRRTVSRTTGAVTHDRLLRCTSLKHVSRKAAPIEQVVEQWLLGSLEGPEVRQVLARAASLPDVDLNDLRRRISTVRAQKDEATAEWADGHLDTASLRLAHRRLDTKLAELDAELVSAIGTDPLLELGAAGDPEEVWMSWPIEQKRQLLLARVDVVVHSGSSGRPGGLRFNPDSVSISWKL